MKPIATRKQQKKYAKKVGQLSLKYHIPFPVCLALGSNEELYKKFVLVMSNLDFVGIGSVRDLRAGIYKRKCALYEVLGEELFEALGVDIMGQKNSKRLAYYVYERCMAVLL